MGTLIWILGNKSYSILHGEGFLTLNANDYYLNPGDVGGQA